MSKSQAYTYDGDDKLTLTGKQATITSFHHFVRILESRVKEIEVEHEVQSIKGGIREKGRLNKIMNPYVEKMGAICKLIRDMSNRISNMDDQARLEYAAQLKKQYSSEAIATLNKLKVELDNINNPERFVTLRGLLVSITQLEMLTDEGAEVEGLVNISKANKADKVADLMTATTINYIGGELNVAYLQNRFVDNYIFDRMKNDAFQLMFKAQSENKEFTDLLIERLELYYVDNLEMAQAELSGMFEHNKAFDFFTGFVVSGRLMEYYEKSQDKWIQQILEFAQNPQV